MSHTHNETSTYTVTTYTENINFHRLYTFTLFSIQHIHADDVLMSVFARFAVESIRKPEGKNFAFVEFRTHAEAAMALESVSKKDIDVDGQGKEGGGGDGGGSDGNSSSRDVMLPDSVSPLGFGWAKGQAAERLQPHGQAAACWFCLASPDVKVHLIVSIHLYSPYTLPITPVPSL